MLALLCSWLMMVLIFLAFGDMTSSLWHNISKKKDKYSFFDSFWLGICSTGVLLSVISIFSSINIYILALFISISIVYWIIKRKRLGALYETISTRLAGLPVWSKAALAISVAAIFLLASTTPLLYDEGLYHLQTMMWSEQYSVVPGLGNLHGRLAFNSNFLLLSTLFNYHPGFYPCFFSINSLSLFVFTTWLIVKISKSEYFVQKAMLSIIMLLCIFSFGIYLSSTSTDILAHILIIYILLSCIIEKNILQNKILMLVILPLFCITLKLSSALICLISVFALIYLIKNKEYKSLLILMGICAIIIIPWCTRFIILSGYLAYPFPAIDIFSFDWKMPIEQVLEEKNAAYAWPRIPNEDPIKVLNMPLTEWVPIWLKNQSFYNLTLYLLALISPIIVLVCNKALRRNSIFIVVWATAIFGYLFGFFTAPDPRFSFSFIICSAFIPYMFFFSQEEKSLMIKSFVKKIGFVIPSFIILSMILLTYMGYSQVKYYQEPNIPIYTLLYKPQSIDYKKNEKDSKFLEYNINNSTIYYPDNGNQCFDQCLPCMPYPNNKLEMRGERLNQGFKTKQN
ncbi:LIC_10190 family membrane protein [Dysgonomonas sp. ZJ279]|uniref:LIC_10190 family membrane protein n=1 Tax=Dysgonomonas sp. ZJ279 TaxID=2709796 RepID=UPI0013ECCB98|nr:hypothetical protein [Dysgonomonas sp. ZJ279]